MTAPTIPETPAAATPGAPAQPQSATAEAITAARQRLAEGQSLVPPPSIGGPPGAASEEALPEALSVTLAGMEERGEAPLELEAPDQETYDRLSRLQGEATLGRQVTAERREVSQAQRELGEVQDMIAVDPAGFIMEHTPEAVRAEVAMNLMFDPEVLARVQEKIAAQDPDMTLTAVLEDPEALRVLQAELRAERSDLRNTLREHYEVRRVLQANARAITAEVDRLLPATITGERREQLFLDAVRDVQERCQRLGLSQLDPRDIRVILGPRLEQAGALYGGGARGPARAPGAAPKPAARPAAPGAGLPVGTGERIKLARQIGLKALVERARAAT